MKRALICLAACGHPSHPQGSVDAAADVAADSPAPPDASPDASTAYQIPPGDLGMIQLSGTCTVTYRGWSFDDATGCTPNDSTTTGPTTRDVTIAQMGALYDVTTTLYVDSLTGNPYGPYTVELGATQTTATAGSPPTCDPIYGTCVQHAWTLAPSSLTLATTSLHDNSSPTPLPQCWEYYYQKQECSFALTW